MDKIIAYMGNQGDINKKEVHKITHLNLAFGKLNLDGSIDMSDIHILNKLGQLKEWNPRLKILVSLVPNHPDAFTLCAEKPELRKNVGQACVSIMQKYQLDGVDFDWEYPCVPSNNMSCKPADKQNFTLLLKDVRNKLDTYNPQTILSIAAGADEYYINSVELRQIADILDYICLMTYDLRCGFHALTGHHTALYTATGDIMANSCDRALRMFHQAGVPKEKLLLGIAFYSRKWENLPNKNNGFLLFSEKGGGYGPNFTELTKNYINKNGYIKFWDDEAKAPYLFNGSTFISYDDEASIMEKCAYVNKEGYGGVFYWEHGSDPSGALLEAINKNKD